MSLADHYAALEITQAARTDEVKAAFRKAALRWHPDKNRSPGAKDRFLAVYEAYAILSDPWKRKIYDGRRDASGDVNPEYDRWSRDARHRGEQYSNVSYDEFWADVRRDVKTILFGSGTPEAYDLFVIFIKMFVAVSLVLGICATPVLLRSMHEELPGFLIRTAHLSESTAAMAEAYALTFTAIAAFGLAVAALVFADFLGISWKGLGEQMMRFFFTVDDHPVPVVPIVAGFVLSIFVYLYAWIVLRPGL